MLSRLGWLVGSDRQTMSIIELSWTAKKGQYWSNPIVSRSAVSLGEETSAVGFQLRAWYDH